MILRHPLSVLTVTLEICVQQNILMEKSTISTSAFLTCSSNGISSLRHRKGIYILSLNVKRVWLHIDEETMASY